MCPYIDVESNALSLQKTIEDEILTILSKARYRSEIWILAEKASNFLQHIW